MVHIGISKRNILDKWISNGTDREAKSTGFNIFYEHVLAAIFDVEAVVLIPNCAVMDPNVFAAHIEAISVESRDINKIMMIQTSSPGVNMTISNFQAINALGSERPIWWVVQK